MGDTSSQSESEKQHEDFAPPPPAPPRGRFGKLWERASSLGAGVVEKVSITVPEKDRRNEEDAKKLPSPPPEPEEAPPKRFVPPLPPARTQVPDPPQLPPRNQSRAEPAISPVEEPIPPQKDGVLFDHDHHDHTQPIDPPPEQGILPIKPAEPAVEKPTPPVLPPRAPRHPQADIVRPGTPSAIPLPDSRPSTPALTTTAERRRSIPSTPTKLDLGRPSSPAPGSTGTPPPIPRRAPTRVRPVSVSLRPSTPLNQPPLDPPEEEKEVGTFGANPPTTIKESAGLIEETASPPGVEAASGPIPEVIKPIFTSAAPRQPDTEAAQIVNASNSTIIADRPTASPVDDLPHATGDNGELVNNQNLVGDKSWEDKTWREVVRLREEMFYARMGIVR